MNLNLGPGVSVRGAMYDTRNPEFLREELVEVDLLDGRTVYVGWYPEHDVRGNYVIQICGRYSTDRKEHFETAETSTVVGILKSLARHDPNAFTSGSTVTIQELAIP